MKYTKKWIRFKGRMANPLLPSHCKYFDVFFQKCSACGAIFEAGGFDGLYIETPNPCVRCSKRIHRWDKRHKGED